MRLAASVVGTGMLIFALVGFIFPNLVIKVWPWQISALMVRVFLAWLIALAVSNLWFWVEKEWTRLQAVAYMLIATPVVIAVMMIVNRSDLTGNPLSLWGFIAALLFIGAEGIFMLWQQR